MYKSPFIQWAEEQNDMRENMKRTGHILNSHFLIPNRKDYNYNIILNQQTPAQETEE
jgi:hypothetical protein